MQSSRYANSNKRHLATSAAVVLALLSLSGCMTGFGKTKVAAAVADPKPAPAPMTPAEQLAAALNAKAAAGAAHKQGAYRDPMVRTASGRQIPLMAAPGDKMMMAAADTGAPGIMSDAPNIAGLVTQPTAVNAHRTSIYSTGMSANAVQMPGQVGSVPQDTDPAGQQGITPVMRSVYSAPASMMQQQMQPAPQPQPEPQGVNLFPVEQSSQNVVPQATVQPVHTALAGSKPVSDATPSKMMPSPFTKGHTIDSKEALMIAKSAASKQQNGEKDAAGMKGRIQVINKPLPQAHVCRPPVSMTPGMAASLKQPIAFKRGIEPKSTDKQHQDQVMIGNLPVHF